MRGDFSRNPMPPVDPVTADPDARRASIRISLTRSSRASRRRHALPTRPVPPSSRTVCLRGALDWLDAKEVDMRESVKEGHRRILPRQDDL